MDNEYKDILTYWFADESLDAPQLDGRMELWFGEDPAVDREIKERFGDTVKAAVKGELNHWGKTPEGRLALIVVLDQFTRRCFRGTKHAYAGDNLALQLCAKGATQEMHRELSAEQRLFFFMPLQRAESNKIQERSVKVYQSMVKRVSATMRETFETFAMIAELRHDVIVEFGRFPHRNEVLGRENTESEVAALAA